MDFFEQRFGVSLDGGNGVVEFAYLMIPVFVAFACLRRYRRGNKPTWAYRAGTARDRRDEE